MKPGRPVAEAKRAGRRSEPVPGMTVALRLLARRACSEAGMRLALERGGISSAGIRRVLGRLRELGYIDDLKFATEWSERLRARGFGSLRIQHQLHRDGIEEGTAEQVVPDAREERTTARRVLQARYGDDRLTDRRQRAQAYRFLGSRGFPSEVIASVLGVWEDS